MMQKSVSPHLFVVPVELGLQLVQRLGLLLMLQLQLLVPPADGVQLLLDRQLSRSAAVAAVALGTDGRQETS